MAKLEKVKNIIDNILDKHYPENNKKYLSLGYYYKNHKFNFGEERIIPTSFFNEMLNEQGNHLIVNIDDMNKEINLGEILGRFSDVYAPTIIQHKNNKNIENVYNNQFIGTGCFDGFIENFFVNSHVKNKEELDSYDYIKELMINKFNLNDDFDLWEFIDVLNTNYDNRLKQKIIIGEMRIEH